MEDQTFLQAGFRQLCVNLAKRTLLVFPLATILKLDPIQLVKSMYQNHRINGRFSCRQQSAACKIGLKVQRSARGSAVASAKQFIHGDKLDAIKSYPNIYYEIGRGA